MSYGPFASFKVTMATFTTLTSEVDLGRGWKTVYLSIPTMTSQTQLYIQGADANSATAGVYNRVLFPLANSASPTANTFLIPSNVTSTLVPIPNGLRYLKVEATAICSFGVTFKVICSD
jgi:hypothetical protein